MLVINPQRACARVTVVILRVCYHTSCYIPRLYVEIKVALSILCHMHCVNFTENALFRSSGDICWPPLPSSLLDGLSMDKIVSDDFFSRWLVCRSNDRSYNSNTGHGKQKLRFLLETYYLDRLISSKIYLDALTEDRNRRWFLDQFTVYKGECPLFIVYGGERNQNGWSRVSVTRV